MVTYYVLLFFTPKVLQIIGPTSLFLHAFSCSDHKWYYFVSIKMNAEIISLTANELLGSRKSTIPMTISISA